MGVALVAFFLAVYLTVVHWYKTAVVVAIIAVWTAASHAMAESAKRKAAQESRNREQQKYLEGLTQSANESLRLFERMPEYLEMAERFLDEAERDFSDGAINSFWDSVEKAVKTLGRFDECIKEIKNTSSTYHKLTERYEDTPPPFPLARKYVVKLSVANATTERLDKLVRAADRNPHFAMIYTQRKTNQILIAGFNSLGQALERMTHEIASSLQSLVDSVDEVTSTLGEAMQQLDKSVGELAIGSSEIAKVGAEAVARQGKALEMLDNIQRGRRPSI